MTGMEMMVAAILKASGIDPEKMKEDVAAYARQLADKIASMDAALASLRNEQTMLLNSMRDVVEIVEALGMAQRSERSAAANGGGPHVTRP